MSGNITICPRVVSLKSSSNGARIPVRVCNLSARLVQIPTRSLLCSLTSVVDSWTPDLSHKQESKSNVSSLEDLGVQIDTDNLTIEELSEAKVILFYSVAWVMPQGVGLWMLWGPNLTVGICHGVIDCAF